VAGARESDSPGGLCASPPRPNRAPAPRTAPPPHLPVPAPPPPHHNPPPHPHPLHLTGYPRAAWPARHNNRDPERKQPNPTPQTTWENCYEKKSESLGYTPHLSWPFRADVAPFPFSAVSSLLRPGRPYTRMKRRPLSSPYTQAEILAHTCLALSMFSEMLTFEKQSSFYDHTPICFFLYRPCLVLAVILCVACLGAPPTIVLQRVPRSTVACWSVSRWCTSLSPLCCAGGATWRVAPRRGGWARPSSFLLRVFSCRFLAPSGFLFWTHIPVVGVLLFFKSFVCLGHPLISGNFPVPTRRARRAHILRLPPSYPSSLRSTMHALWYDFLFALIVVPVGEVFCYPRLRGGTTLLDYPWPAAWVVFFRMLVDDAGCWGSEELVIIRFELEVEK